MRDFRGAVTGCVGLAGALLLLAGVAAPTRAELCEYSFSALAGGAPQVGGAASAAPATPIDVYPDSWTAIAAGGGRVVASSNLGWNGAGWVTGVSVLDAASAQVEQTFELTGVSFHSRASAVSSDGRTAFLIAEASPAVDDPNGYGQQLVMVDLDHGDVVAVPLPFASYTAHALAVGERGDRVWLLGGRIAAVDVAARRVVGSVLSVEDSGSRVLAAARDGGRAFTLVGGQPVVVEPDLGVRPLAVGDGWWWELRADPRGALLYLSGTDASGERFAIVDADDGAVVGAWAGGAIVGFSRDGRCAYSAGTGAGDGELWRACAGARAPRRVVAAALTPDDIEPIDTDGLRTHAVGPSGCTPPLDHCSSAAVCLRMPSLEAAPGSTVDVAVRLDSGGAAVAGVQIDLFAAPPLGLPVRGACTVEPSIDKPASVFVCQAQRGEECQVLRSLVLALHDVAPILDGAPMLHCRVRVADDALPGTYPLRCVRSDAASPDGVPIQAACDEALITVVGDAAQAVQPAAGGSGGCQVAAGAPAPGVLIWPVLLLFAAAMRARVRGCARAFV